jgi:8-oxo-dGTP pyrophosphatase MutT (NUDIX family)
MKERTLLFLYRPEEKLILLAFKKRGFGAGKWNGVGGKLEDEETIEQSVVRETSEEITVIVKPEELVKVAVIDFFFDGQPDWDQRVHVFFAEQWKGEPKESEEMRPHWYPIDALPFNQMWVDDAYWLPRVLQGQNLKAVFHFDSRGERILTSKIETL